jgi:hypothetical protein
MERNYFKNKSSNTCKKESRCRRQSDDSGNGISMRLLYIRLRTKKSLFIVRSASCRYSLMQLFDSGGSVTCIFGKLIMEERSRKRERETARAESMKMSSVWVAHFSIQVAVAASSFISTRVSEQGRMFVSTATAAVYVCVSSE